MGIRGLSTFFNNNPDLSKLYRLYDTKVIFDGDNLLHSIYFKSKLDCTYGGDYQKFAVAVKKYFSSFLKCKIKPIVIFDGGHDVSGRKFATNILRLKTRLSTVQHIAKYGQCSSSFLPIAAKVVFRDVLSEMGIIYAQSDFEADDHVTMLANHYNCPVISDDSDFYIFDVQNGFIRLSSIDTTVLEAQESDISYKFLSCSIYYINEFLSYFPGIDRNVLPLFGTLIGNDYSNSAAFESFFSNIKLPKRGKSLKVSPRQRKIVGLLSWLSHTDLKDGISTVLSFLKKHQRDHVQTIIKQSLDGYTLGNSILTFILDEKVEDLKHFLTIDATLKAPCGHPLPTSFVIPFLSGKLPPYFINAIALHRVLLSSQVEVPSFESSYVCSRYIRQVMYGILLQHKTLDQGTHLEECVRSIEEYDRRDASLKREFIEPIFSFKNGKIIPDLDSVYTLEKEDALQLLLNVLESEQSSIFDIPDSLQLIVACVIFWLKNCDPKPNEDVLCAFAVNILYFQVILKKTSSKSAKDNFVKDNEIGPLMESISIKDAQFAARNLKKYLGTPTLNKGNPLFLTIIHSFSQYQTCLLHGIYLNMLLNLPLKHPKIYETFEGTMIYNLSKDIMERPYPDLFISELIGRQSKLVDLFQVLKNKLFENVPENCIIRVDRSQITAKKKSSKRSKPRQKDVEQLNSISDVDSSEVPMDVTSPDDFSEVYI